MNVNQRTNSSSFSTKWILFVIGSLCIISLLVVALSIVIAFPIVQQRREAARREAAVANMKRTALALHNYEASMVPNNTSPSSSSAAMRTVDAIRELASKQFGVEVKHITEKTSLADLRADDLDFVELIMELEEHFSTSIPDESISTPDGKELAPSQFGELTMLRLAEIVDQSRKSDTK